VLRLPVLEVPDRIFTLPVENVPTMNHNGWLYTSGSWHYATDYATSPMKTFKVMAAAPGTVIHIGWDNFSGNTIVVSHDTPTVTDAYRTIYMHLRGGAAVDCDLAWARTMATPEISAEAKATYRSYLTATGCAEIPADRNPWADNWGTNETIDPALLNQPVTRGQLLAWAGETGPGGHSSGRTDVNTHLHIFWARRDTSSTAAGVDKWYFFDPYGMYAPSSCYPRGITDSLGVPCVRYPVAFKDGRPQFP